MAQGFGASRAPDLHMDVEAAIEKSAKDFKALLNTNHAEEFESSTAHEVYRDLRAIQFQQQEKRTLMNLNRVQMFLDGMDALQNVFEDLNFGDVHGIMACIWGPMKFLLKTTNVNDRAFDHLLEVYQCLGINIPPLSDYKEFFAKSSDAKKCLLHLYRDILEFHRLAYKLFSLRSSLWAKLHRATWKDLDATFHHLACSLRLHDDFIRTYGRPHRDHGAFRGVDSGFDSPPSNPPFEDVNEVRRRFYEYEYNYDSKWTRFRSDEEERKRKQKDKILKWIAAPNKTEMLHDTFVKKRDICPENGRWLYKRYDPVSNWMREDPPQDSTIWVHGQKGMGKTILSSLVITRLQELAAEGRIPRDVQVCYFYCQEGDQEMATYLGILRGILNQLVCAADILTPEPSDDEVGGHASRARNNNATILPLCDDKITNNGGSTLSSPEAAIPLIEAFFDINPRQYVVVDGLDECAAATEIQQTVAFLTAQVMRCEDINQGQLRVLFMGQSGVELRRAMLKYGIPGEGGREVGLDWKDNAQDIRNYVKKRMEPEELQKVGKRFNLTDENVQGIEDKIADQSEGLFLYAELAMEYLVKQTTKADLLEKVRPGMLPDGISNMYDKLLGTLKDNLTRESPAHWEKAKLLLGWLVCAHRPLKWHEIQAILAFDPVNQVVDFDLRMIRSDNISDLLGSLVQVLPGDNIRLIHSSAKQHLVLTQHINSKFVQCDLAILCLRYLSLRCFAAADYTEAERRDHILQGYFSFQDYAMSQWYKHIDTVIADCRDVFPFPSPYPSPAPSSSSDTRQLAPEASAAQEVWRDYYTASFSSALSAFVSAYDLDLKPPAETHPDLPLDSLSAYANLPFHAHLGRLWNHIFTHQKSPVDERNKPGIRRLESALESHRAAIENDFRPSMGTVGDDTMEHYYGPNLFKCQRTLCKFFHQGFDNRKDRDAHHNRHDRPYPCPLETCGFAPVGFSSNKDKERHVRNYHPELSDAPSAFLQMSRRVETAKFECKICKKTFTRNINLKGHERSHFGERPYACSNCGKAFARLNDCRRHERIHTRKGM
ncbi:hypothetical protein EsH8_IV_000101 [Colletotrichum jinshuiense]